jgi:hypothetical protein
MSTRPRLRDHGFRLFTLTDNTLEVSGRQLEHAGVIDVFERRRRFHLLLDGYGYTGDPTAIRDAIIGRVERNVAMIRQFADGGEPTFQRMLPWAADLERSGNEVAELPDEFWQRPGR